MSGFNIEATIFAVAAPVFMEDSAMIVVSGGGGTAYLHFREDGAALPANDGTNAYMPMSRHSAIVELLRNGTGLYYNYDENTGQTAIQSGSAGGGGGASM